MKKSLIILSILFVFNWAESVVLSPTDDMYTDPDHPGVNPVTTELWTADFSATGHFERIMIQFDLDEYLGQTATSAILHLSRFISCPSGGTTAANFYAINEAWDEENWDHTQNIQYDESVNMPYVFTGTGGNAIVQFEVDITEFVNQFLSGSVENNGFLIKANNNQKFSKFYSKEYSNEDYRPLLELDLLGVDVEIDTVPNFITLNQNYPNPFNPSTTISFSISDDSKHTEIVVYSVKGQKVKTLVNSRLDAGMHSVVWNGKNESGNTVPSGIYFYNIKSGNLSSSRKMILMK